MAQQKMPLAQETQVLMNLFNAGRYAEVEERARSMTKRYPQYGNAWKALGTALLQQGRSAEALAPMQRAAALLPADATLHHSLGNIFSDMQRLLEAENSLQRALALKPDLVAASISLGIVYDKQERFIEAEQSYRHGLQFAPELAGLHCYLANVLKRRGRYAEAEASYQRALQISPEFAGALANLGEALHEQGRLAEAEDCYRRVLAIKPDYGVVHINLGELYRVQGRLAEAEASYKQALDFKPDYPELHCNLGVVLQAQSRYAEAEVSYRRALALKPGYVGALNNLGDLLKEQSRYAEAEAYLRQALALDPACVEAYSNLGVSLYEQGRAADAELCYRRALSINPHYDEACSNLGVALRDLGRLSEAEACFKRALMLNPNSCEARFGLGLLQLGVGQFAEGWQGYAWRNNRKGRPKYLSLADKLDKLATFNPAGMRLAIWKDQGLGDELFFLRFARVLRQRGAWLGYIADPRIADFIRRAGWVDAVALESAEIGRVHLEISVGDLPLLAGMTSIADIQPPIPLPVLPEKQQEISQRLAAQRQSMRPLIGITWQGGSAKGANKGVLFKHISPEQLGLALRDKPATYVVVQRNPRAEDLHAFSAAVGQPVLDCSDLNQDLEGMLALMAQLDDYIGVSNTNMHLRAGAGRTAQVLIPFPPDFRWMSAGDHSPWFPGFSVYRAGPDKGWTQALAQLKKRMLSIMS